jgi:hypothetical protein
MGLYGLVFTGSGLPLPLTGKAEKWMELEHGGNKKENNLNEKRGKKCRRKETLKK